MWFKEEFRYKVSELKSLFHFGRKFHDIKIKSLFRLCIAVLFGKCQNQVKTIRPTILLFLLFSYPLGNNFVCWNRFHLMLSKNFRRTIQWIFLNWINVPDYNRLGHQTTLVDIFDYSWLQINMHIRLNFNSDLQIVHEW